MYYFYTCTQVIFFFVRIRIFRTHKEYEQLKNVMGNKKLPHFVYSEIMKKFGKPTEIPCAGKKMDKEPLIIKEFNIHLPKEVESLILCESSRAGIKVSTFISRTIIDPILKH